MSTVGKPVLWHIGVSHYSEKVRWALDWKGVEHERREPPPGVHMALALWWSRGETKTFPVLELDGERILDSTAIIGALEAQVARAAALSRRSPSDRRQALDLEDYFDENLGPAVRLFGWHHLRRDKELIGRGDRVRTSQSRSADFGPARSGASAFAGRRSRTSASRSPIPGAEKRGAPGHRRRPRSARAESSTVGETPGRPTRSRSPTSPPRRCCTHSCCRPRRPKAIAAVPPTRGGGSPTRNPRAAVPLRLGRAEPIAEVPQARRETPAGRSLEPRVAYRRHRLPGVA